MALSSRGAISLSTLLVATSHRRQLQAFLFHNYCDHPCRMAQLKEQLGRINQSFESRAGGNRTVKGTSLYRVPQIGGVCCVECCTGAGITQSQEGVKYASQEIYFVLVNGGKLLSRLFHTVELKSCPPLILFISLIIYSISSKPKGCEEV